MSSFIKDFIGNFKGFIQRIFNNKTLLLSDETHNSNNNQKYVEDKINPIDELAIENKKNQTIKEIASLVEEQPKVVYSLNSKQLNVLKEYYVAENERLDNKINETNHKIDEAKELMQKLKNLKEKLEINA